MTVSYKPVFKKREVVVAYPEKKGIDLGTDKPQEIVAEVLYVGSETTMYEVGDKILFSFLKGFGKEIEYFGEKLLRIENETQVICQVVEQE